MARGEFLGEFEQIVMLAVARLRGEAYGMAICREIQDRSGRTASLGAVYATLDRLTDKGAVHVRREESGGRARWFFTLTPEGAAALEKARDMQDRMWAGLRVRGKGGLL